jgi:nucleotide-binding universal stress UspA family protein
MLPPRRVLSCVDFSEGSRVALSFAARLAKQCRAHLDVLHAIEPSLVAAAEASGQHLIEDAQQELQRFLARAVPASCDAPSYHVVEGSPADCIVDIAQRERADLLVLGTRGLSNIEWWPALGGTLEDVLRRTRTSVLAVPEVWTPPHVDGDDLRGCGPIIAGVNATCPSIDGAVAACRLALFLDTTAILLRAVPPPQTPPQWLTLAIKAASSEYEVARHDFEQMAAAIRHESPVRTTPLVEPGDAARVIAHAARQHPDALVVLGRGTRPHPYGPPGSIVARTVVLGRVPVLMHVH